MAELVPYIMTASVLGLNGGFSPGPLTALVLSEGVTRGRRAGMLAGLAPLVTDAPIVLVALLLVSALPGGNITLGVISLAGAALLVRLGVRGLRAGVEQFHPGEAAPGGVLLRAVGVNFLNPNPYLFWFTICGPLVVEAYRAEGISAPVWFLGTFYGVLVGTKVLLGLLAGSLAGRLRPVVLLWINRVLSACMLGFAAMLVWKAQGLIRGA